MRKWFLGLVLLMVVALSSACGNGDVVDNQDEDKIEASAGFVGPTLQVLSNDEVGDYLADDKGMALYYFKN